MKKLIILLALASCDTAIKADHGAVFVQGDITRDVTATITLKAPVNAPQLIVVPMPVVYPTRPALAEKQ